MEANENGLTLYKGQLIASGAAKLPGISVGYIRNVSENPSEVSKVEAGEIVVMEGPWIPYEHGENAWLKNARAFVAYHGVMSSEVATVARDLGIPAVIGTGTVTHLLETGQIVIVDGYEGAVYNAPEGSPGSSVDVSKK